MKAMNTRLRDTRNTKKNKGLGSYFFKKFEVEKWTK